MDDDAMMGSILNRVQRWIFGSRGADDDDRRRGDDKATHWWTGAEDDLVARNVYFDFRGPQLLRGRGGRPLRILALHGSGSNNDITAIQLVSLEWHEKAEVDCLAGPLDAAPHSAAFRMMSELPFKCWWRGGATADAIRPALAGVLAYIDAHGPYDGLYGFSMGAQLIAALSTPGMAEALGSRRSWTFVVCACGVSMANNAADDLLKRGAAAEGDGGAAAAAPPHAFADGRIDVPSLHIIGRKDMYRPMSVELSEAFDAPDVVYHDGGHELPLTLRKNATFKRAVGAFLEARASK